MQWAPLNACCFKLNMYMLPGISCRNAWYESVIFQIIRKKNNVLNMVSRSEWRFRPRCCTERLYWAGYQLGQWDDFSMNPSQMQDQSLDLLTCSPALPLRYGCPAWLINKITYWVNCGFHKNALQFHSYFLLLSRIGISHIFAYNLLNT